ncbi:hypothetical protein H0H92_014467 [Tricholoma furcatifolium]|nr:hypothetical protein H0H92_014467 [Tricholoma furcatifolium]
METVNDTQLPIAELFDIHRSNDVVRDVIAKMRDAAADPSPLTRLIEDPAIIELSRLKKQSGGKGLKNVPSIRRLAIEEEEYQLGRLKALLRCAADHLEHEVRRAGEAEVLARYAQSQEKGVRARLETMELAKSRTETELQASVAECQRLQLELQSVERDLQFTKIDLHRVENLKGEYEKATGKAEEKARQYKDRLIDYRIRESNLEHDHQIELLNTLDEGREDGFQEGQEKGYVEGIRAGKADGYKEGMKAGKIEGSKEGRAKGYQEGRDVGRAEGVVEGRKQGHMEERRTALEAFDRFLDEESNEQDDKASIVS